MTALFALGLLGGAEAVEPADRVRVELVAGGEAEGWFLGWDGESLSLSGDNQVFTVPLALVEAVSVNGDALTVDTFRDALPEVAAPPAPVWRPSPALAGGASLIWPGSGHAMMGDWGGFAGYTAVELVLWGGAAWWAFGERRTGPLVTVVLLDAVFRVYAVAESVDMARRARIRVAAAPLDGQPGFVFVGTF